MDRRSNLTACGIFCRRLPESSSPPESQTKRTVSLASSLRTKIRDTADLGAHVFLTVAKKGVVPARACAHHLSFGVAFLVTVMLPFRRFLSRGSTALSLTRFAAETTVSDTRYAG